MLSEWPKRIGLEPAKYAWTLGTRKEILWEENKVYRGDIVRFSLDWLLDDGRPWRRTSTVEFYATIEDAKKARFQVTDIKSFMMETQYLIECREIGTEKIGYINSGHMVKIQPEKKLGTAFFSKLFSKISLWS